MEIRPISDLRNNFADISKIVHESDNPIFFTKNGYGDMVVMSMESYSKLITENEIYSELKAAAQEAETTSVRYTHEEVIENLRQKLTKKS